LWLLKPADQAAIAGLVLLAAGGMFLWWRLQADSEGRPVDIDHASPLKADFRVDINQAHWPELAQLPGIGPPLARRIVEHRMTYGPFRCWKDVEEVRGIGPKKLEQIKPYLFPLPDDCPRNRLNAP